MFSCIVERRDAMSDGKPEAVLAANFSENCGDETAQPKKAAASAIKALKAEGFVVARDPEP